MLRKLCDCAQSRRQSEAARFGTMVPVQSPVLKLDFNVSVCVRDKQMVYTDIFF